MKLVIVIFLLVSQSSFGQLSEVLNKRDRADSIAKSNIKLLKDGALLIRLQSRRKLLSSLLRKGDSAGFREKNRVIALEHLEIVNAVRSNYLFSAYYFFYSHHSGRIKNEEFEGVLLNESFQVIDGNVDGFLVLDPYSIEFSSMNSHQAGLCVLDGSFKQLTRPFPYYVRKRDALSFFRRDLFEMIALFQKKLEFSARNFGIGI